MKIQNQKRTLTQPFLNQLYNLELELAKNNICIENATKEQARKMQDLMNKTIEQSGLSFAEISMICMYRMHKYFNKKNNDEILD
ncbi:MAG: hypothetical protein FWE03_04565 [Firmicutes bacterium]|nr:hypothetical protein [Bacillota bacterium]